MRSRKRLAEIFRSLNLDVVAKECNMWREGLGRLFEEVAVALEGDSIDPGLAARLQSFYTTSPHVEDLRLEAVNHLCL